MIRSLSFLLCVLLLQTSFAQFAIVKDKDGYVNIRQEAGTSAAIKDTLSNGQIVYCFEPEREWLPVDYKKKGKNWSGYIHQSRLVPVSSFDSFSVVKQHDSLLHLKRDNIEITIASAKFSKAGRRLQFKKFESGNFLTGIDNKTAWGTDGNIPARSYRFIKIKSGGKEILISKQFLNDLFEPNMHMTEAYLDRTTGNLYISALNSDGAGGYAVIWVVKDGKLVRRETFIPF